MAIYSITLFILLLFLGAFSEISFSQNVIEKEFGSNINANDSTSLQNILDSSKIYQYKTVIINGRITKWCERDACWLMVDNKAIIENRFKGELDNAFLRNHDSEYHSVLIKGIVNSNSDGSPIDLSNYFTTGHIPALDFGDTPIFFIVMTGAKYSSSCENCVHVDSKKEDRRFKEYDRLFRRLNDQMLDAKRKANHR